MSHQNVQQPVPAANPMNNLQQAFMQINNQQQPRNNRGYQQRNHAERKYQPSLYVGNLPTNYYDLDLYKLFTSKGYKIKSAVVKADKRQSNQQHYGYLTFYTDEQADKCQQEMNNTVIGGRSIILNKANSRDFDKKANIIVRNLSKNVPQQQVYEQFKKFGQIKSCKLEVFTDGTSRGFCYIQYSEESEAKKAAESLNGKEIEGKPMEIVFHEKRSDRNANNTTSQKFTNLFVNGLPAGTNDQGLKDLFADFGEIVSAVVQKSEDGNLREFGYINFKEPEAAQKAVDGMHKKKLADGNHLIVSRHISKQDNKVIKSDQLAPITRNLKKTYDANIYIKFIPEGVSEEQFTEVFGKAGNIVSTKLNKQANKGFGTTFQYGYVLYEKVEEAQNAIKMYEQSNIFGPKPLKVDFWLSKQELQQEKKQRDEQDVLKLIEIFQGKTSRGRGQQVQTHQMHQGTNNFMNQQRGNYQNRGGRGGKVQTQGRYQNMQQQIPMPMPASAQIQGQQQPVQMVQQPQPQQLKAPFAPIQLVNVDISKLTEQKDQNERRQFVGNTIYDSIEKATGDLAGKITGMLLDERVVNFEQLLQDMNYLNEKVTEAFYLLKNLQAQQQMQQQQQVQQPVQQQMPQPAPQM